MQRQGTVWDRGAPRRWLSIWLTVLAALFGSSRPREAIGAEVGAAGQVVVSLVAPSMDWERGRRQVEAELRTAGYEIQERRSTAEEPSALLDELSRAPSGPAGHWTASMTVVRVGATGIAYVYLPDEQRVVRVLGTKESPEVAAGALALRVFETVSIRSEGMDEGGPEPAREAVTVPPPPAVSQEPPPRSTFVLLGVGAIWPGLSLSAGAELALTASFPVGRWLRVEPEAGVTILGAKTIAPAGMVTAHQHRLGVSVAAEWRMSGTLLLSGSGGAGAQCYALSGEDSSTSNTFQCTFSPQLGLRWLLEARPVSIWLGARAGLALPVVRITDAGPEPLDLGAPFLGLSAGIGVPFR